MGRQKIDHFLKFLSSLCNLLSSREFFKSISLILQQNIKNCSYGFSLLVPFIIMTSQTIAFYFLKTLSKYFSSFCLQHKENDAFGNFWHRLYHFFTLKDLYRFCSQKLLSNFLESIELWLIEGPSKYSIDSEPESVVPFTFDESPIFYFAKHQLLSYQG